MSLPWITINAKLQEGIAKINSLDVEGFSKVLNKVVAAQSKTEPFTREDLQHLQSSLDLSENDVQLLLQTISYIFKQSSKIIIKPTVLLKQLTDDLKLGSDKAEVLLEKWAVETKTTFDLENRAKLIDVSWELNMQTASTLCSKEVKPNAKLQFDLQDVNDDKESLVLEMDEDELLSFYNTLETIQNRLDNVRNKSS